MLYSLPLLLRGLTCHKAFWLGVHHSEIAEAIKNQDSQFNRDEFILPFRQQLFPDGLPFDQNTLTSEWLRDASTPSVFFDCTITVAPFDVTYDILEKTSKGLHLTLFKASVGVKNHHYIESAFLVYIASLQGINITRCSIVYINANYLRGDTLDLSKLFIKEVSTKQVIRLLPEIEREIKTFESVSVLNSPPKTDIGEHCRRPLRCVSLDACWAHIPNPSIFDISGLPRRTKYELYRKGITDPQSLSHYVTLSKDQDLQVKSNLSKHTYIDKEKITRFLNQLHYPLCFLDFEAFQSPVPLYPHTQPFISIPFQYSLHTQYAQGEEPKHNDLLVSPGKDPRRELAESLVKDIPENACILVFDASFETVSFQALIAQFPDLAVALKIRLNAIVDLAIPFNHFDIYNRDMKGRRSIKHILSAFVPDLSYDDMAISDGEKASKAYLSMITHNDPSLHSKLTADLLAYCYLDTYAMVKLLAILIKLSGYKY